MPFFLPNGDDGRERDPAGRARAARAPRLRGDPHAAHPRRGAVEALRALGQLPREHVLHAVRRGREPAPVRGQADELPGRLPRVRVPAPLVPRPAAAAGGVRALHAQRARGRAARPAARARVHAGRRARVLHRGADRAARCATSRRRSTSCTRCSASTTCASSCRRVPRSRSAPTRSGRWRSPRSRRRSSEMGREYKLNPGDGAFYGPKIDFHITDALGRSWQCGTCQLDFFMPERFELTYTAQDDTQRTPVMIHRALLGSIERFLGILIEHYAGEFPVWLAPVQARVLPIADRHADYAEPRRGRAARRGRACRRRRAARSRWAGRSATPSWRRSRTCWWSATRRRSRRASRCGATARATSA